MNDSLSKLSGEIGRFPVVYLENDGSVEVREYLMWVEGATMISEILFKLNNELPDVYTLVIDLMEDIPAYCVLSLVMLHHALYVDCKGDASNYLASIVTNSISLNMPSEWNRIFSLGVSCYLNVMMKNLSEFEPIPRDLLEELLFAHSLLLEKMLS